MGNVWSRAQRQNRYHWCGQRVEYNSKTEKRSVVWATCGVQLKDRKEICCVGNVWSTAQRQEISIVRAMCGIQLKDRKEFCGVGNLWSTAQREIKFHCVGNV